MGEKTSPLVDFLDLDISTDGGATWTNLLSWNEDHHPNGLRTAPGEAVNIDLSAYANMSGLILRWHYYDPTGPATSDDWYAQIDDVSLSCVSNAIDLVKTVGTDPNVCASGNDITVNYGDTVYYCYEVTNTGVVTLTNHDLTDTELGTILSSLPFSLVHPGASVWITQAVPLTASVVNTATWTAYNPGPTDVISSTDSATVTVVDDPIIVVDPTSLYLKLVANTTGNQTLTISNYQCWLPPD